jgi:5-methylcytosine-specific restriction endonuclease McrA
MISKWRDTLFDIQRGKCFYCSSYALSKPEVDHVLPWSYVLEDKTWNLVLACQKCNGSKSDQLPEISSIEKLIARNSSFIGSKVNVPFLRDFDE